VREKFAAYNGQKAALKRELREAVVANEGVRFAERTRAFEALADQQWPHLVTLEQTAEEIRRLLPFKLEVAPPPPPPWIPAGILEMIRSYNEDRDTYFAELRARTDAAAKSVPGIDPTATLDERVQQQREYVRRQTEARRRATLDFQEQNAARYESLERRYNVIREALTVVAEKQSDRKTGRALDADTLLRQYGASMEEFNTFGRESAIYTNYRIAMLHPGLSPEQRRLLLGYALVGLAQPLPHGELIPRRNATRPYPSW
jgi:hypothetical protein